MTPANIADVRIRVVAFATAADALGTGLLDREVAAETTVARLKQELEAERPAIAGLWGRIAVAIDGVVVTDDARLAEGCEVALLPPVSGGSPGVSATTAPRLRAVLVDVPIDLSELAQHMSDPECGALVTFVGTVRAQHQGREVVGIDYSGYRSMARQRLEQIVAALESELPGLRLLIVHRLGRMAVGEASVAILAASPHRQAAYEASRRALERLKAEVPIWKREHYADGNAAWREEEPLA